MSIEYPTVQGFWRSPLDEMKPGFACSRMKPEFAARGMRGARIRRRTLLKLLLLLLKLLLQQQRLAAVYGHWQLRSEAGCGSRGWLR